MKERYILTIVREDGNGSDEIKVAAAGRAEGGRLTVGYAFDGANYLLTVTEREIRQRRTGGVSLDMTFKEGATTVAVMSDGTHGASFEIFTRKLAVAFKGDGCDAECVYSDGCGGDVKLSICARVSPRA